MSRLIPEKPTVKTPAWPQIYRIPFLLQTALLEESRDKQLSIDAMLELILRERYKVEEV